MLMHRFTRQTYTCPLFGLMLVTLSACGSGDGSNTVDNDIAETDSEIASPSVNPFDSSDQPVQGTPVNDDTQTQNESPEETQVPVGSSTDTSDIAGFWNLTQTTPEGDDVVLVLIGADGQLTEFDYQADNTGDGRDCYIITDQQIVSRGAGQFDIQNDSVLPGSAGSEDVLILVEDGNLVFRFFALVPAPEGGNELSPQSVQFPASDLLVDDLTDCA